VAEAAWSGGGVKQWAMRRKNKVRDGGRVVDAWRVERAEDPSARSSEWRIAFSFPKFLHIFLSNKNMHIWYTTTLAIQESILPLI
jgi:hypothetical protein